MNDELQKALAATLQKTTQAAEAGAAFLQAELPDVIRQLLMWKMVESAIAFTLFTLAAFAFVYASRRMWKLVRDRDCGEEPFVIFPIFGACTCLFIAANCLEWLQIWLAPKVYLIEYAARLAK